ncbi:MAG: VOC family protein [bacterium]
MQKIQSFIWFNDNAEEAAKLYTSLYKNSHIVSTTPGPGGSVMGVTISLNGIEIILLNGGDYYKPTPGISHTIYCNSEDEINSLWGALSAGGNIMMNFADYPWAKKYGWTNDKYGVSWQFTLTDEIKPVAPSLLFAGNVQGRAQEALNLYTSLFPDSKINIVSRYEAGENGPEGKIKFSSFSLCGQDFIAMDSGVPMDNLFTPGMSLFVNCESQEEVDRLWDTLGEGGRFDRCGWLQDKFGVSWQIVPTILGRLLGGQDKARAGRAMQAMLGMGKLDIAVLEAA